MTKILRVEASEAGADDAPGVFEGGVGIVAREPEGGQHAEGQAGAERECRAEKQDAQVEPDTPVVDTLELPRHQAAGELAAPCADEQTENPACGREHEAFGEQLDEEIAPGGAECGADGHLTLAGAGARQKHVGNVYAGDE